MGCDIHCYIEYRSKRDGEKWSGFGSRINPGRCYGLFERIAGVRGNPANAVVAPRGYPDDAGYEASSDYWKYIAEEPDDDYVTPETAAKWVQSYGCRYRDGHDGKPRWVSHPDWHSHTWLTPSEWSEAIKGAALEPWCCEYRAMEAAMNSLLGEGRDVRVVIWFDN